MEKIEDTLLYRAISYYGKYTNNQAKVLCFLVENAVDNRIYPSIKKISEATGVIKSTVYAALNALQLDGVIEKSANQKGILEIKQDRIDFIVKFYSKNIN